MKCVAGEALRKVSQKEKKKKEKKEAEHKHTGVFMYAFLKIKSREISANKTRHFTMQLFLNDMHDNQSGMKYKWKHCFDWE